MAAVVKLSDAKGLGGNKPEKRKTIMAIKPKLLPNKLTAKNYWSCIPKFDGDAMAALSYLSNKLPVLHTKVTPKVTVDMDELRSFLATHPNIAKLSTDEDESALDLPPWETDEVAETVESSSDVDISQEAYVPELVEFYKAQVKHEPLVEEEELVTAYFSKRVYSKKLRKMVSKMYKFEVPKTYLEWLEFRSPMTKKSGEIVAFDLLRNASAKKKVAVTHSEPVMLGDIKITSKTVTKIVDVPVYDREEQLFVANANHVHSLVSSTGMGFEGYVKPEAKSSPKKAKSRVLPDNVVDISTARKAKQPEMIPYELSVVGMRDKQQKSLQLTHSLREKWRRPCEFSTGNTELKYIGKESLASETDTVYQSEVTVEPSEVPCNPCDLSTAGARRKAWILDGKPKARYRPPRGKDIYIDGLMKVTAADRAQPPSQEQFWAWCKEKNTMLLDWHQQCMMKRSLRKLEEASIWDANRWLAEQVAYDSYWKTVEGLSSLLMMELRRPSLTRSIRVEEASIHEETARETRYRILKEMQITQADEAIRLRKERQHEALVVSFVHSDPKKNPYGLYTGRVVEGTLGGKAKQVANKTYAKPASIREQVLTDKEILIFNNIVEEQEISGKMKVFGDSLKEKVADVRHLFNFTKDLFKPNDSGILVPT